MTPRSTQKLGPVLAETFKVVGFTMLAIVAILFALGLAGYAIGYLIEPLRGARL